MNRVICTSCGLPFLAAFANFFHGNVLECTHCHKGSIVIFKENGIKYLIAATPKGKRK